MVEVVKVIQCDACDGTGNYYEGMPCVRCSGHGTLDMARLQRLRTRYFPNRLTKGAISKRVFDDNIAELDRLALKLGAKSEKLVSDEPVLLTPEMCDRYGVTHATPLRELKKFFPLIYVKEF